MISEEAITAGAKALWKERNRNAQTPSSPGPDHIDRMMAATVLKAAEPHIDTPAARLLAAYHKLYDVVWNRTTSLESDRRGYSLVSHEDSWAIEEAASEVEQLLARRA